MRDWIFDFNPLKGKASPASPAAPAQPATAGAAGEPDEDWSARLEAARGDDAALLALSQAAAPLPIRLAAVEALQGEAALKEAERAFRERDRRVHRLAKQRHVQAVAQREARARADALIADARALCAEPQIPLNRLVELDRGHAALDATLLDPVQRETFAALMAQLASLTRERADQPQKLKRWIEQRREALARLRAVGTDAAAGAQTREQLAAALAAAEALLAEPAPADAATTLATEAAAALARTLQAARTLDERLAAVEAWLQAPRTAADPATLPPLGDSAWDRELAQRLAQWHEREAQAREQRRSEQRAQGQARQQAERAQRLQSVTTLLEAAEAALAEGHLAPAQERLTEIDGLLAGVAAAAVSGTLRTRIDAAQAQYAQLKGWQQWGGGRARDELVQQAEALAAAVTAAQAAGGRVQLDGVRLALKPQAELIDELRARWKALDRQGGPSNRTLWQRFDAALKTAYGPVAQQVAAQREARAQNLAARQALLDQLEAVPVAAEGAPTPSDPRALAAALDRFQAGWRKLGPLEHTVPHAARDGLAQRLEAAVQRLQGPLAEARGTARQQRERLLERARALSAEAAGRDLVDRVRELQQQWQQQARTLPLARADENTLWAAFKGAIDDAFGARQAAAQARDAEFKARAAERVALIERLEALPADAPAATVRRQLTEADEAWHRAPPPPRQEAAALDARYRRAREALRDRLAGQAQRQWDLQCQALEAMWADCERPLSDDAVSDPAGRVARWDTLGPAPEPLEAVLRHRAGLPLRAGQVLPPVRTDDGDSLLLQLEAAWNLESPPAQQEARRLMKLQAMKAALETRRGPHDSSPTPPLALAELLRRPELRADQRERLAAVLAALRRRGWPAAR